MADTTTSIIITAKDQTATAFASVNNSLSGLAGGALKVTGALSALGATAAAGSFVAFTKNVLEAQDNLFKLSQKTGLAVESLAGLEFAAEQSGVELDKVAKATRVFREIVIEAGEGSEEAAKKLAKLGLKYEELKDLNPEKQLLALSEAFSKIGKDDRAVVFTSVFGQKMADLIPLLNNGSKELSDLIEQGKKLNPVTEASARQAEKFNDQINLLSKNVSALGREFVQGMIPGLSAVTTKMVDVTQQSGLLAGALAGVKELFIQSFGNPKILGDVGQLRREVFKTQELINNLEKKRGSLFFDENALLHEKEKLVVLQSEIEKAVIKTRDSFPKVDKEIATALDKNLKDIIERGKKTSEKYGDPLIKLRQQQALFKEELEKGAITLDVYNRAIKQTNEEYGRVNINAAKKSVSELNKKQSEAIRIESEYIKLLELERKAQADLLKPYQDSAKSAQDRLVTMKQEVQALELSKQKQISLEQAIELTTIARLEEKKAITKDTTAVAEINKEIAARKQIITVIQQNEDRTRALATVNQQAADQTTQFWIQANRNIQSSLANGIFDMFNDGLDGMVRNVKTTVLRIISEFAALKTLELLGGAFGGAGGSGGTGGQAVGWLAGLGSMFGGMRGGSVPGVTSGVFSNAGGAGTAFIGGKGTALGGTGTSVAAPRGTGIGSGNLMAMGSMAGPYGMAAAAAVIALQALEKKVGDYKLNGGAKFALGAYETFSPMAYTVKGLGLQTPEALIGKFLFGRGPYKFRQQSLQGNLSSEGIDGTLTDVFKQKNGIFVGTKHKSIENAIPSEIFRDVDKSLKGIFKSTREFATNLGIDAKSIDSFTKEIQIKSEKNKTLTTESVKEMLDVFNEDLIKSIMPNIDSFKLTGETAGQTFARLNNELESLKSAVQNLGGSATFAKDLINGMSIDTRSALVDMAGGIDALLEKTQFFSENFLTSAEQLAPVISMVNEEMAKLGFSSVTTKDQFKALVQSLSISAETRNALLDIAPAFLQIVDAAEQLAIEAKQIRDTANQDMLALAGSFAPSEVLGIQYNLANEALGEFGLTADMSREKLTGLLREFVVSGGLYTDIAGKVKEAARLYKEYISTLDAGNQIANQNLLTLASNFAPDEVLGIKYNFANDALKEFGLSADMSREKLIGLLREFVVSGGLYTDLAGKVQEAAALYKDYISTLDAGNQEIRQKALETLGNAFSTLQSVLDNERTKATDKYNSQLQVINESIANVTDNVARLKSISGALKNTLNTINPLGLDDARSQIRNAIASTKKGNVIDLESVRTALDTLGQKDTSGFSNRTDFLLSQGKNASLINQLSEATDKQLTNEEKSLKALEESRDTLKIKFDLQLESLNEIAKKAQEQVNGINGVSNSILSLSAALSNFNKAAAGATSTSSKPATGAVGSPKGNPKITSKDIVDFAATHTPMEVYKKARELGVSSDQIVASGVASREYVDKFLKDNNLPSFDVGGIVPSTGLALVHKGERVINPQQNEAIVRLLQDLIVYAKNGAISSNDMYRLLRDMSTGTAIKTVAA